ncbi:MAG: hypothetical protein GY804_03175 [Alphaproteobacteria bacterium]|nr:hypothetical protein [Alphaproteobacteria bacterium]
MKNSHYKNSRLFLHAQKEADEKGFVMVLLLLLALSVLAVKMAGLYMEETQVSITVRTNDVPTKMKKIQDAITAFAISNNRLPCPAQAFSAPTTPYNVTNYDTNIHGIEASGNASCTQFSGTVPWGTLGLSPEDVVDGWGNRISYHVFADIDTTTNTLRFDPTIKINKLGDLAGLADAFQYICDNKHTEDDTCPFDIGFQICGSLLDADGDLECDDVREKGVAYALVSHGEMNYDAISATGGLRIQHNNNNHSKSRNSIFFKINNPYDKDNPTPEALELYDMQFDAGGYPIENPADATRYDDIIVYDTFEELFSVTRANELKVPEYCAGPVNPEHGIRAEHYDYAANDALGGEKYPSRACINELFICYKMHKDNVSDPVDFENWNTSANCGAPGACTVDYEIFWPDHTPANEKKSWLEKCPWDITSRTDPDFY